MNQTYNKVIEIIEIEKVAIERSLTVLDPVAVDKAIALLSSATGKVVVSGVGKSGAIAEKISQTMTSTGTMAVFLRPSDALHGGLGVVSRGDVVIALSNSGETDELLAILPTLTQREVPIIALVGNVDSTLARAAAAVLDASVDKEACPLNLAPTASTTVALAIGDAIAMALMDSKGLTAEDFASNHPAGRLGKRLTLRVRDLMHKDANVLPTASWIEVVRSISDHSLGAVNVVDADNKLVGIVTDGDLRRTIERTSPDELSSLTAKLMMTAHPITASPEMLAYDALKLMENRPSQISVLPVMGEFGECVGLLRLHDVVRNGL